MKVSITYMFNNVAILLTSCAFLMPAIQHVCVCVCVCISYLVVYYRYGYKQTWEDATVWERSLLYKKKKSIQFPHRFMM